MSLYKRGGTYWYQFQFNGERARSRLGSTAPTSRLAGTIPGILCAKPRYSLLGRRWRVEGGLTGVEDYGSSPGAPPTSGCAVITGLGPTLPHHPASHRCKTYLNHAALRQRQTRTRRNHRSDRISRHGRGLSWNRHAPRAGPFLENFDETSTVRSVTDRIGCAGDAASAVPRVGTSTRSFVIVGADVGDGSGAPLARANVRVLGDRIARVGTFLPAAAEQVVDGKGLVLAPGFIDTHNHSDGKLESDRLAESQISQGLTTLRWGRTADRRGPSASGWINSATNLPRSTS
jgi:hypothetical protein